MPWNRRRSRTQIQRRFCPNHIRKGTSSRQSYRRQGWNTSPSQPRPKRLRKYPSCPKRRRRQRAMRQALSKPQRSRALKVIFSFLSCVQQLLFCKISVKNTCRYYITDYTKNHYQFDILRKFFLRRSMATAALVRIQAECCRSRGSCRRSRR